MTTVAEMFGLDNHYQIPSGEFYCGVEYEIEDIKAIDPALQKGWQYNGWMMEEDHSLRNNGKEFKTTPQTFKNALQKFNFLHANLKLGKQAFSERTSTHVHVNVRDFTPAQLRQVVLVYALVEPVFFSFVGDIRKNSIFCVPLNYTYMPSLYKLSAEAMIDKWHKYTAFNIVTAKTFGTIEFRHLYGTADYRVFEAWLTSVKDLTEFVRTNPDFNLINEIKGGLSISSFARRLVPSIAAGLSDFQINNLCADTLLDVKLSVGGLGNKA